jgi:hypothetical protein
VGRPPPRRQFTGREQPEVDDTLQPIRAPAREGAMLTASVWMRSEFGVLDGVGRQLIADNQKLK